MAVVLIGSTGNGKSTLGNFIIDPSREHRVNYQSFPTATDNKPHTQDVHTMKALWEGSTGCVNLTIVDTPGLNENPEKDLEHMIDIIKNLQTVGSIQACLFVVKFNTKIDVQYKDTVAYYSRLLPTLFERNTAIVMTDFPTDDRSLALRKQNGIDVERVKANVAQEIVSSGGLRYNPSIFAIDCMPVGEEEGKLNLDVRQALLSYICDLPPVKVSSPEVAKPAHIKQQDGGEVTRLDGEIASYKHQLKNKKASAAQALDQVEKNERDILAMEKDIENYERQLKEKNTDEVINVKTWTLNEEWKSLQALRREFCITSECKITNVNRWQRGDVRWEAYDRSDFEVKGIVTGRFMRGLYASLEVQTTKKEMYKEEITTWISQIESLQKQISTKKQQRLTYESQYSQHKAEITALEKYIDDRKKQILQLEKDTMSMDEAIRRSSAQK